MINEHIFIIRAKQDIIIQKYLFYFLKSHEVQDRIVELAYNKTAQSGLNQQHFKCILIPLPDLSTQQEIVNQIEQEEKIIAENKKLIEIMENKMQKKIKKLLK